MCLLIFDIDGTLTETTTVDEECFVQAFVDVCGFNDVDTDWSNYKHATDAGIFQEIFEARMGRCPLSAEVSLFRRHFVDLLARESRETPFGTIAGAPQLLSRLAASRNYRIALATGAWRDSARLKMASAGLCFDDFPAASSDDAIDRESIIRLAIQRANERFSSTDSAVYVGDGLWDVRASRNLGIPFIGIARGDRAAGLRAAGAVCVMPDFTNPDLFLNSVRGFFSLCPP